MAPQRGGCHTPKPCSRHEQLSRRRYALPIRLEVGVAPLHGRLPLVRELHQVRLYPAGKGQGHAVADHPVLHFAARAPAADECPLSSSNDAQMVPPIRRISWPLELFHRIWVRVLVPIE